MSSELITINEAAVILAAPRARAKKLLKALPVIDYGRGRGCGKRWARTDVETLAKNLLKREDSVLQSSIGVRPCSLAQLSADDIFALTRKNTLQ